MLYLEKLRHKTSKVADYTIKLSNYERIKEYMRCYKNREPNSYLFDDWYYILKLLETR
jgi:hypothetical protein